MIRLGFLKVISEHIGVSEFGVAAVERAGYPVRGNDPNANETNSNSSDSMRIILQFVRIGSIVFHCLGVVLLLYPIAIAAGSCKPTN